MTITTKVKHNNSFDLIRHVAALSVLYSHHFAISGRAEPAVGGMFSLGGFAVVVFFAISGYLVSKSFTRCTDFLDFLGRRSLRIFPAYIVCCLIMIYVLGLAYTNQAWWEFLTDKQNLSLFLSYSLFVHEAIPVTFEGYHLSQAVNGSLWTLPVEFACYLLLGGLLSFSKTFKPMLCAIVFLVVAYLWVTATQSTLKIWYVSAYLVAAFASSFFVGALLGMTESTWKRGSVRFWLGCTAAVIMYVTRNKPDAMIIAHLLVPVIVIFIGASFSEKVVAGKYDISYGIYIYAFPVQQIMINATPLGFWSSMAVSFLVTSILASASWFFIEKPAIKLSKSSRAPALDSSIQLN
jgi:peptidoglycan/LPS O-acetylase OafA/YrhL